MTDYAKVRAILDAATPGPWALNGDHGADTADVTSGDIHVVCRGHDYDDYGQMTDADARAIVVSRNLAPALLAVAEVTEAYIAWQYRHQDAGLVTLWDLRAALAALDAEVEKP